MTTWKVRFRGLMRDMCVKFQPWQDMDKVRTAVRTARLGTPRLPWMVGREWTWRFVLKPRETREEWNERMNTNAAYLARKLELAEKGGK